MSPDMPKHIKPARLHSGDTVALISPASRSPDKKDIALAKERLEKLGLKVTLGKYVNARDGYFAGSDQQRADDVNHMFSNPNIKAIFAVRGGWGCARILKHLDFDIIANNPKILVGFSDITTLLIAINKRTGLITFHGPMAALPCPAFTVDYLKKVLFNAEAAVFRNPNNTKSNVNIDLIQTSNSIEVINPGIATGKLIGGNLTILMSLIGTPYAPEWDNKILFVEEVNEPIYRIDRMLEQLQQADVLNKLQGFIFGSCINCHADKNGFTLSEILAHYFKNTDIPTYMGAMIGHQSEVFTLPQGLSVELNANNGTIKMLAPSVQ